MKGTQWGDSLTDVTQDATDTGSWILDTESIVILSHPADIEQASIHFLELKHKFLLHIYLMHPFDLAIC